MKRSMILLICISTWGCVKKEPSFTALNEENTTDLTAPADWDKLLEAWEYVPLETNDLSRLENIDACYIYGDYIFIKDTKSGEARIMQFKLSGDFMHQVGKQGSGEKEYGNLGLIWVNLEKQNISLYDGLSTQKRVTYDFAGNFISSGKADFVSFYTRQMYPLTDGKYIGYCACGLNNKMCYFTTDNTFGKFDTLRTHVISFPMGFVDFAVHPIAVYQNRVSCVAPLCDTIFEYSNNKLTPRFVTTVHRSVPIDYKPTEEDYWRQLNNLKKDGYFSKNDIFETTNWFIITYDNGKLFYEKNRKKGYFISKELPARGDMIYPNDLWGQQGEKLIAVFTPEELLAIKTELEMKNVRLTDRMQEMFGKVRTGGNPWLFFYNLK